ncbi:hypothetical protein ABEB36_008102 [Hypothenemus hampei]|uniref:Breast cancer type 1 susceptibility protein homolog n=1 Tax=Hypothenemus hampei TaxID=57062 RepID=A0ABD1ENN3_HYPHA
MDPKVLKKLSQIIVSLKSVVKCPICLDFMENIIELECSHTFCSSCFNDARMKSSSCPLCKKSFSKRSPVYKDTFANALSKFVNNTDQIIKEQYALNVERLSSDAISLLDLQEIIETSPLKYQIPEDEPMEEDTFDAVSGGLRKCYFKKRKLENNTVNFKYNDTRLNVINWLNDSEEKWNNLTQNPKILTCNEEPYEPSTQSFVKGKKRKKPSKLVRAQSLTDFDLPEPLIKKYHSLTEEISQHNESVNVEEIESEELVKQVERKVVQNLLEDQCLSNFDHMAADLNQATVKNCPGYSKREAILNSTNSGSSNGWDRIKNVKDSLKKHTKQRKKLQIHLQDILVANKQDAPTEHKMELKKTKMLLVNLNKRSKGSNLAVTDHMKLSEIPSNSNNSKEIEIVHRNTSQQPREIEYEEEIFTISSTSVRSSKNEQQKYTYNVSPVSIDATNLSEVVNSLTDNLTACLVKSSDQQNQFGTGLFQCFSNLLTYVDKITEIALDRSVNSVAVQTNTLEFNNKSVQTNVYLKEDAQIQTNPVSISEKHIQEKESQLHSKLSSSDEGKIFDKTSEASSKIIHISQDESTKSNTSKKLPNNQSHISEKELFQGSGPSNKECSTGSALLCSLPSSLSGTKRKLIYGETPRKRFKRIKRTDSDASDDSNYLGPNPNKKNFINSDLSVEFADSENPSNQNDHKCVVNSENEDYDQYIVKVMSKYAPDGPKNPQTAVKGFKSCEPEEDFLESNDLFAENIEKNFDKIEQEIEKYEQITKPYNTQLDLIESTPSLSFKPKKLWLSHKKTPLIEVPKIKGKDSNVFTKVLNNLDVTPCTLERNIKNISLLTSKCTSKDVAEILEDLQGNDDFFKTTTLTEKSQLHKNISNQTLSDQFRDVIEDDKMESQLRKICFGEECESEKHEEVIEMSDEEIVETTPQKKKLGNSFDRSFLQNVVIETNDFNVCLPPPPGFEDETNNVVELKENRPPLNLDQSTTQYRLTDCLVTPDVDYPRESSQHIDENTTNMSIFSKGVETYNKYSQIARNSFKTVQKKCTSRSLTPNSSQKKYNLMTSTPNQKSILNYVKSSPNLNKNSSKPCVMWSRICNKDNSIFSKLESKNLITTSKVFGPNVTHLVIMVDEMGRITSYTAKILQAIAAGIWVVRYEWVEDSLKLNKLVSEIPYEALDTSGEAGPKISRLTRKENPLFHGFRFYCAPPLKAVSKQELEIILKLCGGEIANDMGVFLNQDSKVNIILTENSLSQINDPEIYNTWLEVYKVVTVEVEWLTNCIGQYNLVSFRPYILSSEDTSIGDLNYPPELIETVAFTMTET